ncbi:hypothetical protein B2M27_10995 [Kluyvera intermedia]|uniref:Membrane protein 6-pyruvoyl-tetrahydropterin synthase-related domain-containing protein n=1 Tax=Kluyvera intermedia TaxID=61648 RepID=A0ABX3UFM4_KLUIN|nr:hypothetical protein [Kluyvera intermedia]ORJ50322.1 hypothetical protein B2M27_10995 [Kluyvera intermedia]
MDVKLQPMMGRDMRDKMTTQRWSFFLLSLTLAALFIPMFHHNLWGGDDWGPHVLRLQALNVQLDHQQFPPLFDYWTENQYGLSWGAFYPPLSTLLLFISRLFLFGFDNNALQMKFTLGSIILISAFSAYYAAKREFSSATAGHISASLFISSSYFLCNFFQRFAVGECLAMAFMPLLIRGCNALLTGDKDRKLIPLSCTLILLANIPSFIVVLIFFFIFSLINIKKIITRENIIFLAKSALVSLLISSFYWLPLIYHMHYSDIFAFTKMQKSYEFINQTRVKIAHVLFATKNTSGTIGYSLFLSPGILIIVLSFIALFTDKERTSRSMLLVAVILTLMLCPVFSWNWIPEKISVLQLIQFSWRLLSCITAILSLYAVLPVLQWMNKTKSWIFILPTLIALQITFPIHGAIFSTPPEFSSNILYRDYVNNNIKFPITHESLNTAGSLVTEKPNGFNNGYPYFYVKAEKPTLFTLPYIMYSGYYLMIDNKKTQPIYLDNGFIGANVEKGMHTIALGYDKNIYIIPGLISLAMLLIIIVSETRLYIRRYR